VELRRKTQAACAVAMAAQDLSPHGGSGRAN
jgi:hypothetical protein